MPPLRKLLVYTVIIAGSLTYFAGPEMAVGFSRAVAQIGGSGTGAVIVGIPDAGTSFKETIEEGKKQRGEACQATPPATCAPAVN